MRDFIQIGLDDGEDVKLTFEQFLILSRHIIYDGKKSKSDFINLFEKEDEGKYIIKIEDMQEGTFNALMDRLSGVSRSNYLQLYKNIINVLMVQLNPLGGVFDC